MKLTPHNAPHIAIVAPSLVPDEGVGGVANRQIELLAQDFRISAFSAKGSVGTSDVLHHKVKPMKLNWLRRFAHSPREVILAQRFGKALATRQREQPINLVLYHSHVVANIAHRYLPTSVKSALLVHGDIFSRPPGVYDRLLTRLYKKHSLLAYQACDLIVALSQPMAERIQSYGVAKHKIAVIPNGLPDIGAPKTPCPEIERKRLRVLFVGRLNVEKDPLTLVTALRDCPPNVHLTLVGDGSLRPELESFVQQHGLSDRVAFLGKLDAENVAKRYQVSDVLCVSSTSDSFPTVILEAMSMGLPVVGSDVDGIPFMVEHEKTGLLFPPSNHKELARHITHLANHPKQVQAMGQSAYQRFKHRFTLEQNTQALRERLLCTIQL